MKIIDFFNRKTDDLSDVDKVVGGAKQVNDFGNFYETHANELAAVALSSFIEWSTAKESEGGFDSKEQVAFMDGITKGLGFFEACFKKSRKIDLKQEDK